MRGDKMKEKEIPRGFKKTEIGIIPEDWEVKKLGEIGKITDGDWILKTNYTNKGVRLLQVGDIGVGKFLDKSRRFISKETAEKLKCTFVKPENDILISRMPEPIGRACLAPLLDCQYIVAVDISILQPNENIFPQFVVYKLNSEDNLKNINKYVAGGTRKRISRKNLEEIKLYLPPYLEQQTIANTLSDFDKLIESLDKLIEKKKNIKKGTMQLLLTGKKRLPGFTGEWVTKKLGEIGEVTGAGVDKKAKKNEIPVRLLNYLDVYKRDFLYDREINFWTTAPKSKTEQCSIKKGDVFFTPSSELQTDIAISAVAMEDFKNVVYSYHIIRFRLKENWDLKFRTYIFKTKRFLSQAEKMAEGSGKRYVISLKNFRELEITYPLDIGEQRAIAQILSDMDAEIEALEKKKQKYEMMKKAAMELLLTGKIRLKEYVKGVSI